MEENQKISQVNNIYGAINNTNFGVGESVTQNLINHRDDKLIDELKSFMRHFEEEIKKLRISNDDADDLKNQAVILNKQIDRKEPNLSLIGNTLKVLYDLSTEVAGSAISGPILVKFQSLMQMLTIG